MIGDLVHRRLANSQMIRRERGYDGKVTGGLAGEIAPEHFARAKQPLMAGRQPPPTAIESDRSRALKASLRLVRRRRQSGFLHLLVEFATGKALFPGRSQRVHNHGSSTCGYNGHRTDSSLSGLRTGGGCSRDFLQSTSNPLTA